MKVVHLITALEVGGAETMLYKLLSRMDRERFSSTVVSMREVGVVGERIQDDLGVPVMALGMKPSKPTASGARRLAGLLRSSQPSILQTWLYHADLLGILEGRLWGVPRVLWNVRCSNMEAGSSLATRVVVRACAALSCWPDAIVTNTRAGEAFHRSIGYCSDRWVVIPNGFDPERFAPDPSARASVRRELGIPENSFLVGMFGRFHAMKDHGTFLRAAARLGTSMGRVDFLLAGPGVTSEETRLSEGLSNDLAQRIHLIGQRDDVPRLMAALDVAVSSSAYGEGFPNVVGEAMSCGVPCVVTDVGDSAALVADTGLVVQPRDPEAMAAALRYLLLDNAARHNLGSAARQRIIQHFGLDQIAREYESLYLRLERT